MTCRAAVPLNVIGPPAPQVSINYEASAKPTKNQQESNPKVANVPVVVLSALDPGRAANVSAAAFLKKPLDFDRLLQLVRQYCR